MKTEAGQGPAYQRRKADRPAEIVQAGLEEFFAQGYAKASLARIAQRAGVSRATLYLYFDGKDALFEAVAAEAMGPLVAEMAEAVDAPSGSTEELVRRMLRRFYGMITGTKNSALMRILIAEGKSHPDLVARYHALIIRRGEAALGALVQRGIARGELRAGAATAVPQMIVAPAVFYLLHTMIFGDIDRLDVDDFLEAHMDMLFNGMGARSEI
ncbi:MAG: TetR/AcrR family transcriptional regulator [Pseudomonadota bacterium]